MSAPNNISRLQRNQAVYEHFRGYASSYTYCLIILLAKLGIGMGNSQIGVYPFIDRMVGKGIFSGSVEERNPWHV